ncbi:MAG TPA: GAF and ANTAR domain-containing protein [Nocardioidaceae bacterium]|nr:GAF and ANTAR domain-containing protein [Nocardioidaceae bacterium]
MPDDTPETQVIVAAMSRVARSLGDGADVDKTLQALTHAALEALPGVDSVTITMADRDGSLRTLAPTSELGHQADVLQYELREGPCLDAVALEQTIRSADLTDEERWPAYAPRAAKLGIGSQMAIEIFRTSSTCAGLNVYSTTTGALDESRHIVELFASQAAIAMNFVRATQTLQDALISRKTIGQAIGIVMERYGLDEDRAFDFLVRTSQDGNVKLRAVAQNIVDVSNQRVVERA